MEKENRIIILLLALTILGSAIVNIRQSQDIKQLRELKIPTISEEEKYFDQLTEDIIQCESQGKMVWGDLDKPHKAYGVAQFQERTFDWMCKLSGKNLDYANADHQRELLRWALENNYGRMWTCYYKIKGFQF